MPLRLLRLLLLVFCKTMEMKNEKCLWTYEADDEEHTYQRFRLVSLLCGGKNIYYSMFIGLK